MIASIAFALALQTQPFEFRGHRVGDPQGDSFRGCLMAGRTGSCEDKDTPDAKYGTIETVGGVYIRYLRYEFFDDQLYGVRMGFEPGSYLAFREMLVGKYGEPDRERDIPMQNGFGGRVTQSEASWAFPEGTLYLRLHFPSQGDGLLIFKANDLGAAYDRYEAERRREAGASAF